MTMTLTDFAHIKNDFPIFGNLPEGFAYCDSVATSQTPQCVLDAMEKYYTTMRANIHRASYPMADTATSAYEGARADIARFIGAASPEEIVFTAGATMSSNMLYLILQEYLPLRPGDDIVTSVLEHHSHLLPVQLFAEREGLNLLYAPLGADHGLDHEATSKLIGSRTRILALTLASNVTGAIVDARPLIDKVHTSGGIAVLDASAYVGHAPFDVSALDADVIFFSGHKMLGPTGIGVLYGKKKLLERLRPAFVGGGMSEETNMTHMRCTDSPYRFEAGTPPIAEAIGLGRAARYLDELCMGAVRAHVRALVMYATETLTALSGVTVHSMRDADKNIGIVSCTVDTVHPHDVAHILGERGVAVRAGHHCAEPLVKTLGVPGTVRAGFHVYNTHADVDALAAAIAVARETFV